MDGQESITSSQVLGDGTPKTPWNAKSKGLRDILLKPPDLRTEVEIEEARSLLRLRGCKIRPSSGIIWIMVR
ncbi:unnamed protein product [Cladocopium goreaui]|uniref:Uncharacterized protein n=1 Tax=Cladocopium goreaui TaxID=2562237 RepID=A0A9P1C0F7_9DINO|nr:unnamed protein product [Cladocopium goreaui]